MNRYWFSWAQPTKDYRSLTFPPHEQIMGWWCSGYSDDGAIICALIKGKDDDDVKNVIKIEWPEAINWRFCQLVNNSFILSDRFPLSEWMLTRLLHNS